MSRTKYEIAEDAAKLYQVITDEDESLFIREKALLAFHELKGEFKSARTRVKLKFEGDTETNLSEFAWDGIENAVSALENRGFNDVVITITR
ncbi:MAG: hypothetical protein ACRDCE_01455 [Cetobacterium sp.]|uniref:hypothetical protein n=1 Tax=Cetobacterium sp. TaxID=2071632 RepID=UPI003EE763DE